jgi:hypothetical protein
MNPGYTKEGFPTANLPYGTEATVLDEVYVVCDAEFNSRQDVHESFKHARGVKSWARFYLMHEVGKVAHRDGYQLSYYQRELIAQKISQDWFAQAATSLN